MGTRMVEWKAETAIIVLRILMWVGFVGLISYVTLKLMTGIEP